jgi:hypothetical protein
MTDNALITAHDDGNNADWRNILEPKFLTEEDVVAKLRFVARLVANAPYHDPYSQVPVKDYYERVTNALKHLLPQHRQAALAIFSNVVYISDAVLDSAWVFLCDECMAANYPGQPKKDFADASHVFEVDASGMANRFFHHNGIEGRLDYERLRDAEQLIDNLILLTSTSTAERTAASATLGRLFQLPHWVVLTDCALS